MKPNTIFSKTALGKQVIEDRNVSLDRNLRLALILVDGHSDLNQLRLKAITIKNLEQELEQLALGGYIKAENQDWQNPIQQNKPRNTSNRHLSPRAKLIDAAILVLGDDAQKIVKLLRTAPDSRQGLEETISRCKKIVRLTIDEKRAGELHEICQQIMDEL